MTVALLPVVARAARRSGRRRPARRWPAPVAGRRGARTAALPGDARRARHRRLPGPLPTVDPPRRPPRARRTRCSRRSDAGAPVYRWTTRPQRLRRRAHRRPGARRCAATPRVALVEQNARPPAGRRSPGAGAGSGGRRPPAAAPASSSASSTPASGPRARCSPRSPGSVASRAASAAGASPAAGGAPTTATQAGRRALVRGRLRRGRRAQRLRRSRRSTTAATAPRWRRSPPATPGSRCRCPASGSVRTAGSHPRPGSRSTRRAGRRPTPPTTAAPPPTWSPPIDRPPRATASTCSASRSAVRRPSTPSSARCSAPPSRTSSWSAAAGNGGAPSTPPTPSPWVTSVGGTTGDELVGRVAARRTAYGSTGAMASTRTGRPGPARAGRRRAGRRRRAGATARICRPGSLDASRTEGRIVVCERGGIGRVDKSEAVHQADGVGMVLANVAARQGRVRPARRPHRPPGAARGQHAATLARRHPRAPASPWLPPACARPRRAVTPWSSTGDPTAALVKPDVVGPAVGLLGAVPPAVRGTRWDFVTGTSAAAAWTSGLALRLRASHRRLVRGRGPFRPGHDGPVGDRRLLGAAQGAGRPRLSAADAAGARVPGRVPCDYRAWLDGEAARERAQRARRSCCRATATAPSARITNVGRRTAHLLRLRSPGSSSTR